MRRTARGTGEVEVDVWAFASAPRRREAATRLVEETDGEAFVAVDLIDTEVRGGGGGEGGGVVFAAGESRRGERRGRENA